MVLGMGSKMSKSDMVKWGFNIGIPLIIALIPCGEVYTMQMKLFFVSTVFAILCFALDTVNQTVMALILPAFWVYTGVTTADVAYGPWTQYIPWVTLGGLVLAAALQSSGLLYRIAYFCLVKTGGTYKGIIWGIFLVAAFGTLFIGDIVIPMAALVYGICLALGTGKSKATAGIMLTAAITCLTLVGTKMTGPMLSMGIGMGVTGPLEFLGYFESFYVNAPIFLETIIMVFLITKLCKPENDIQGKEYFEQKLAELGKVTVGEMKCAAVLVLFLGYIVTKDIHGLSLEWGMVVIPLILALPGIGCTTSDDIRNINYGLILFVTACMAIGAVAGSLGVGQIMVNFFLPLLDGAGYYTFFLIEFFTFFLCNFVMTPLAMAAGFTVPFASLATELGINPMAVYYFMLHAYDQIVMPYEYALYLIYFAFGMIHMKDFMKIMGIKCIVAFVIIFALLLPWWNFLGFIYV